MNKKKMLTVLTCVVLMAVLFIGGTFALLSAQTDKKTNTFTVGKGISGELKEPEFDGDDFTDEDNKVKPEGDLGKDLALEFVPSREIPKDPAVANTSDETATWVAVTIEYTYGTDDKGDSIPATYDKVFGTTGFATVDLNTTDWIFSADKKVAYYKTVVDAGKKTATLFNTVKIKDNATLEEQKDTDGNVTMIAMDNFDIIIKAYLVQAEGSDDAQTAMHTQWPELFE